jgi:CRISPR locus-related DNA-binding protein
VGWVSQGYVFYHGEAYTSMDKKCIIIGTGINITPARLALINADVNDGDYVILVGNSADALNALVEFARQVYQDLNIDVKSITINTQVSLVDAVSTLRSIIEVNAPCDVVIGIAGDRWVTTILSFLAMTLATVGGFVNVSVDRVFIMPDKGEPIDWPIVPRLVDLSLVEFRVLRLICSGYGLAKEIVNGYSSKFNEAISLQAIERTLAKLRVKGLVNGKRSGKALMHEATELGRLIACS